MNRWEAAEAEGNRYYGAYGTIHNSGHIDVVTDTSGNVVEVWFRCQQLPFRQAIQGDDSGETVGGVINDRLAIVGIELRDTPQ